MCLHVTGAGQEAALFLSVLTRSISDVVYGKFVYCPTYVPIVCGIVCFGTLPVGSMPVHVCTHHTHTQTQ